MVSRKHVSPLLIGILATFSSSFQLLQTRPLHGLLKIIIELAYKVAGLVYDFTGGDPATRPRDFL